jgi:putative SbcD/Mre11-related phosphoesterase
VVKSLLSWSCLLKDVASKGYRVCDGVEIFPGGAALLSDENILVVADMHLGCESALENEGLSIPRVQTRKIGQYMTMMIDSLAPSKVVVAGDLKHNFSRNLVQEGQDVQRFIGILSGRIPLEVIKGNHDNYLGLILREYDVPLYRERSYGGVRIVHGHSGVLAGGVTLMGHIHPSLRLRDGVGASVKDQCFLYSDSMQVLVLPALSIVFPGSDVIGQGSSDTISPLLAKEGLSGFVPIAFSGEKALKFPTVGELREIRRQK